MKLEGRVLSSAVGRYRRSEVLLRRHHGEWCVCTLRQGRLEDSLAAAEHQASHLRQAAKETSASARQAMVAETDAVRSATAAELRASNLLVEVRLTICS